MFHDRTDAAERLLGALPQVDPSSTVVLALPRGGVPVAAPIARALGAPLDLVLVRKVGAPGRSEFAVGAVTDQDGMQLTVHREAASIFNLDDNDVRRLAEKELPEIARRRAHYLGGRDPLPLKGRTAIVVDDGIATGATVRAALRLIRKAEPERVILAVPVAPAETVSELGTEADEVVCLETPSPFYAVGQAYRDFEQVGDQEVIDLLREAGTRE